jgi:hypothetical protein
LSFAGRIAGIASRLPLGFQGGFPRGPLQRFDSISLQPSRGESGTNGYRGIRLTPSRCANDCSAEGGGLGLPAAADRVADCDDCHAHGIVTGAYAMLYRGMDRAQLDAAYNNTAAVPERAAIIADWGARSAKVRREYVGHLDLA